jgi:hypothetical protein
MRVSKEFGVRAAVATSSSGNIICLVYGIEYRNLHYSRILGNLLALLCPPVESQGLLAKTRHACSSWFGTPASAEKIGENFSIKQLATVGTSITQ